MIIRVRKISPRRMVLDFRPVSVWTYRIFGLLFMAGGVAVVMLLAGAVSFRCSRFDGYCRYALTTSVGHTDRLFLVWAIVVVVFFSTSQSKLPGYILTAVVALSVLVARVFAAALGEGDSPTSGLAARRLVLRATLVLAASPPRRSATATSATSSGRSAC